MDVILQSHSTQSVGFCLPRATKSLWTVNQKEFWNYHCGTSLIPTGLLIPTANLAYSCTSSSSLGFKNHHEPGTDSDSHHAGLSAMNLELINIFTFSRSHAGVQDLLAGEGNRCFARPSECPWNQLKWSVQDTIELKPGKWWFFSRALNSVQVMRNHYVNRSLPGCPFSSGL